MCQLVRECYILFTLHRVSRTRVPYDTSSMQRVLFREHMDVIEATGTSSRRDIMHAGSSISCVFYFPTICISQKLIQVNWLLSIRSPGTLPARFYRLFTFREAIPCERRKRYNFSSVFRNMAQPTRNKRSIEGNLENLESSESLKHRGNTTR